MYVGLYDVYNKSFKNKAEVCGTITANCGCSTGCGCFMKIEKVIVDDIYKDRDARIYNQVAPTLPGDCVDAFNMKVSRDGISPTITTRPEGKKTAIPPPPRRCRRR